MRYSKLSDILEHEDGNDPFSIAIIEKEDSRYKITTVSTAALEDREGETFDVEAMDFDIEQAYKHNQFPEYRVFHSKKLGIGRVEKMARVGIFAVEEGHSYTDPFSLEVCEKMLANNDGIWRVSRGFQPIEVHGGCPACRKPLVVKSLHMVAGFRCPACYKTLLTYKGTLGVRYKKARTFDITVTDVPAVPYTGASATRSILEMKSMTKDKLKSRLLKAGISEEAIEERLKEITDEQLKEYDEIPFAHVLKEFKEDEPEDDDTIAMDWPAMKKELLEDVAAQFKSILEGFTVEVADFDVELKEVEGVAALQEEVAELKEMVEKLLEDKKTALKEMLDETSRGGKLRIRRELKEDKKPKKYVPEDDDDEEDDDEEDDMPMKEAPGVFGHRKQAVAIVDQDGNAHKNMTSFVTGR